MAKKKRIHDKLRAKRLKRSMAKTHIITLEGDLRSDIPPSAQCTCGWTYGPSAKLMELGLKAKEHAIKTGHQLRRH